MGGIQYLSGEQDGGPTRVGVPIADISAGMSRPMPLWRRCSGASATRRGAANL